MTRVPRASRKETTARRTSALAQSTADTCCWSGPDPALVWPLPTASLPGATG